MATQHPAEHRTTHAEAVLMRAIDQLISQIPTHGAILIDYDFLRDYTVVQLQQFFFKQGEHAYTEQACMCVHAKRHYYTRRALSKKKFNS